MICSNSAISIDDYPRTLAKLGLYLLETDGVYKVVESNSWYIWFKYNLIINEPTLLSIQLFLNEENVSSSVRFKIINNDTNEEDQIFLLRNVPRIYTPNEVIESLQTFN